MKVGVLLNENCPTFNNWKKWQGINESWHTSEMQCPSVLLDFYSQIVQITLWWPRGLTSPCRRISVKELPMCTEKNQTDATCVIIHLLMQAIWGHIWKCTVEKSQTNATYVILHPVMQALWRHIWKCTVEKSRTNATNVTMHPLIQALWGHIWKCTVEKSPRNVTNVIMHAPAQTVWGHIWKSTVE